MEDTPLLENKSSTKDVNKGTDELVDTKTEVVIIRRKGLDNFEGHSKVSTGWFKLDSGFLKQNFLQSIQDSVENVFKRISRIKTWNCIQCLL